MNTWKMNDVKHSAEWRAGILEFQLYLCCPSSAIHCHAITRSAFVAAARKTFQLLVGASRRRAAPRSQSSGAAHVAQCHFIGLRRPLNLQHRSKLHQSSVLATKMKTCIAPVSIGVKRIKRCGLTLRSTGPIAAGRHLGHKSLAQMPARRNRPVSSNVRPHISKTVPHHL